MCAGCRTCAIVYKIYMKQLFSAVLNGLLATQLFSVSVMVILVVQVLTLCSVCYTCKQESGYMPTGYMQDGMAKMQIGMNNIKQVSLLSSMSALLHEQYKIYDRMALTRRRRMLGVKFSHLSAVILAQDCQY